MRIAITGATGFVGSHLANRLASEGHELVLIASRSRNIQSHFVSATCAGVRSCLLCLFVALSAEWSRSRSSAEASAV
jgi:nucleoside-diphosphate-sugar epimerase